MFALIFFSALSLSLADLSSGQHDGEEVVISGIVDDSFPEDTDRRWNILQIRDGNDMVFVSLWDDKDGIHATDGIIGARVRLKGVYHNDVRTSREALRSRVTVMTPDDLTILEPPPKNPFDLPGLNTSSIASPSLVATFGRRTVTGTVLAAWNGRFLLVKPPGNGKILRINLATEKKLPARGVRVQVAGIVETDLFRYNLSRARFQELGNDSADIEASAALAVKEIFHFSGSQRSFNPERYGKTIRGVGTIRHPPTPEDPNGILVECGGNILLLNVSSCPDAKTIAIGSRIAFSGICVFEVSNWRPTLPFPQIEGVTLVTTSTEDVKVLPNPPWWTPRRLLALVGCLIAILSSILIWNILLRRIIERRGKELADETIARLSSDLKVYERTRLAVELHDSLAQNLTGVSMEIDAANKAADRSLLRMHEHLAVASRTLKSCRDELRNCLWDLRNRALEESDMNTAIRQTLAPHLYETRLFVRFQVPRERISDNSAHAILRIIRELTINAIRHGKATEIRIAGSIEGDKLMFSVKDNGCGFDPKNHPGVQQGHYGLLGISERIDAFEGAFTIDSAPGKGTRAILSLNVPKEKVT